MKRRLALVFLSVLLLSLGWWGVTGLSLLVALVPLMIISENYSDSRRDWWRMCGWATLTFLLWNVATIWWVWIATPLGPITAGIVGTFYNLCGFMTYHYVSKRAPRALAYTLLITIWLATEWAYNSADVMTFPWLLLGHGFSADIWAVQWYEYTGIFGGTLWALLSNVAIFDILRHRDRSSMLKALAVVLLPIGLSLVIYASYTPSNQTAQMSVVQPSIPCYEQERAEAGMMDPTDDVMALVAQVPETSKFVVMPESMLYYLPSVLTINEENFARVTPLFARMYAGRLHDTKLIVGGSTISYYGENPETNTAHFSEDYGWFDHFNSALLVNSDGEVENLYHKGRLVIGVEAIPLKELFDAFEVDLGGVSGQLGWGMEHTLFEHGDVAVGPAICYEGLYGDYFAGFAREGANAMAVISNDGWWGDTPGHRRLFAFCQLRAIETRRAIARSANTGISGFISPRGDIVGDILEWNERGVLTEEVELRTDKTFYVQYGDLVARIATFTAVLALLYYVAYRIKRRNYLVD